MMKMVRINESTHQELRELGKYDDTLDDIVKKLIDFYSFNHTLDILNERDKKLIPTRFMETLCRLDSQAIRNGRRNEFDLDDLWEGLGGYNKEKVYPLVEHLLWSQLNLITKNPDGRISLTNEGRKHCGEKFDLPHKVKELF
jgi:hypothetical protein